MPIASALARWPLVFSLWIATASPLVAQEPSSQLADVLRAYAITFGWALVGTVSMGLGVIITLKLFTISTREVDEWALVKQGNIPIAIILAALILSLGIVVASVTK